MSLLKQLFKKPTFLSTLKLMKTPQTPVQTVAASDTISQVIKSNLGNKIKSKHTLVQITEQQDGILVRGDSIHDIFKDDVYIVWLRPKEVSDIPYRTL